MRHILLIISIFLFTFQISKSADCFQGDTLFFHSQADIDLYGEKYSDCTNLEASIIIEPINSEIYSLRPLENIESISGVLIIKNTSLIKLTGLHNVYSVGFGVSVINNNSIIGLTGLNRLNMIGQNSANHIDEVGFFKIESNDNLINLWGIENLDSLMGDLIINENDNLLGLDGLESLQKLNGFRFNGESIINSNVIVTENKNLSRCSVMGICALRDYSDFIFEGNTPECNNVAKVQGGCSFISVENMKQVEQSPYPNPTSGIVNIQYENRLQNIRIVNFIGEVVFEGQDSNLEFINISNEPSGIYYLTINGKTFSIVKK